jgi:hypothetical protein
VDIRDYGLWRQHFGETTGAVAGSSRQALSTPAVPTRTAVPSLTPTGTPSPTSTPMPSRLPVSR